MKDIFSLTRFELDANSCLVTCAEAMWVVANGGVTQH